MTGYVAVRPVPCSASQARGLPVSPMALQDPERRQRYRERCRNGEARIRYKRPKDRHPDGQGLLVQGKARVSDLALMEMTIRNADTGRYKPLVNALASVRITGRQMTQTGPGINGLPGPGRASRPYAATENRPLPHGKPALAQGKTANEVLMDLRLTRATCSMSTVYANFGQAGRPRC